MKQILILTLGPSAFRYVVKDIQEQPIQLFVATYLLRGAFFRHLKRAHNTYIKHVAVLMLTYCSALNCVLDA